MSTVRAAEGDFSNEDEEVQMQIVDVVEDESDRERGGK